MNRSLKRFERNLAEKLVDQCLHVRADDTVTITMGKNMIDLAEEVSLKCFEAGADVLLNLYTDKYYWGYSNLLSIESLKEPSKFCIALTETYI